MSDTSIWHKIFRRELPDGTTAWGFGAYVIFIVVGIGLVWWVVYQTDSTSSEKKAARYLGTDQKAAKPVLVDVKPVATPALATEKIEIEPPAAKTTLTASDRGVVVKTGRVPLESIDSNSAEFDDPLAAALTQSTPTEESSRSNRLRPRGASSAPRDDLRDPLTSAASGNGNTDNSNYPTLASLDVPRASLPTGLPPAAAAGSASRSGRTEQRSTAMRFLPRGERIPVYVLTTAESGRTSTLVELGVARNIYFNGKLVLPFGYRFLGQIRTNTSGQRVEIDVEAIRDRTGLEVAATGYAEDTDGRLGVPAYYYAPPIMVQAAPLFADFATAYSEAISQRAASSNTTVILPNGTTVLSPADNQAQQQVTQAASAAIGQYLRERVKDLEERYPAYLAIYAGTPAVIRLTSALITDPFFDERRLAGEGGLANISDMIPTAAMLSGRPLALPTPVEGIAPSRPSGGGGSPQTIHTREIGTPPGNAPSSSIGRGRDSSDLPEVP